MSIVFVPQEPRRHLEDGSWVPLYDLSPALQFGTLNVLLPHGPQSLYTTETIKTLNKKLEGMTDDDYILLIGDPTAMAATVMVASRIMNGELKLLKYDRNSRKYNVVIFKL
jgi:hypothetical protein